MLKTKSVYAPADGSDGVRVLVTRYWPRGVRKDRAGFWFKGLGPSPALISDYKSGRAGWDEFKKRYEAEFREEGKGKLLDELRAVVRKAGKDGVTLLCTCKDEETCHRGILKAKLEG